MTRKRFIKLLMSRGASRKWASWYASNTRAHGVPYATAWREQPRWEGVA